MVVKPGRPRKLPEELRSLPATVSLRRAAEVLGVSRSTVLRMVDDGTLDRIYLRPNTPRITKRSLLASIGEVA